MAVEVGEQSRVGMPEPFRGHLRRDSSRQHQGGASVPEPVSRQTGKPSSAV
jgi:hypothetical protein